MSYIRYQDAPNGLWRFLVRRRLDGSPVYSTDPLDFRQHDFPFPGFAPLGQETADSVLSPDGYATFRYESFPPWQPPYTAQGGNGGDVMVVTSDGWAKIVATMDGGHPGLLYYFVGPGVGQPNTGQQGGWVIAGPDVAVDAWNSVITYLQQSPNTPNNPIGPPSPSYTRYLRNTIAVPFLTPGVGGPSTPYPHSCIKEAPFWAALETIVSEHYETDNPATSTEMERFHFANSYGMIRWEFWSNVATPAPYVVERAPSIAYGYPTSIPLNPSFQLCDVRHYANLEPLLVTPATGPASALYVNHPPMILGAVPGSPASGLRIADFGWPPNFMLP